MASSAFKGVFNDYTLVFKTGASTTETVTAFLKPNDSPAVRQQAGADVGQLVLSGRLTDPGTLPSTIKAGYKAPLALSGRSGAFELSPQPQSLLSEVTEALGQKILGVWTSDEL